MAGDMRRKWFIHMNKSEQDPSRILNAAHARSRKQPRQFLAQQKLTPEASLDMLRETLRRHDTVVQAIREHRAHGGGARSRE